MRKIIFVALIVLLFQKWGVIKAYFHKPTVTATSPATVVLYGTKWCGYCTKARAFFAENHIIYQDHDVEVSIESKRQF